MPTSGELKSEDFSFITPWYQTTPPHSPRRRGWELLPIKSTSMSPNRLRACNVHRSPQQEKRKKISEVFRRLPNSTQSWPEVFMMAQTIRKVSKVHQSILNTKRFLMLLFNEDPIRQPSLGYIWRQDVSLQWGKGSKSLFSGRFGYPYGRPEDLPCIWETPGLFTRVGMYDNSKINTMNQVLIK